MVDSNVTPIEVQPDPYEARIRELVALYAPKRRSISRPCKRVLAWLAKLHASLAEISTATDPAQAALAPEVRQATFMIEGLLRLYSEHFGKKMNAQRLVAKEIEDALGAYGHALDMLKIAEARAAMPAAVRAYWRKQVHKEHDRLDELLHDQWLVRKSGRAPALKEMVRTLLDIEWESAAGDRKVVQKSLAAQCDRIASSDWDMHDLQEGIHEMRRQLRWPPIYGMALDGALALAEDINPEPAYEKLRDDPVAKSPFATLPTSEREKNPVQMSRTLYLRMTQLIDALGKLKDRGEAVEGMARALVKTELTSKKEAEQAAARLLDIAAADLEAVFAQATELYPEVKRLAALCRDSLR